MSPIRITINEIDDVPGYRWELNWTDAEGEHWSEEHTDDTLPARVAEIAAGWPNEETP